MSKASKIHFKLFFLVIIYIIMANGNATLANLALVAVLLVVVAGVVQSCRMMPDKVPVAPNSDSNDVPDTLEQLEMPSMDDPFFSSEKLLPRNDNNDPEWTEAFKKGDNMLMQQNFIDTTANPEKFQVTRSVCGRKYLSRDLRRVPTVTRDPSTINSFNLPVIDPVCAQEYNNMHGNLDWDCNTQVWVKDENSLAALGYPLPKDSLY
jgi:hypothetical protein